MTRLERRMLTLNDLTEELARLRRDTATRELRPEAIGLRRPHAALARRMCIALDGHTGELNVKELDLRIPRVWSSEGAAALRR